MDYLTIGNNRAAVADLTADLRFNPKDADAYGYRAYAQSSLGAYPEALLDIKTAFHLINVDHVSVDPSFVVSLWNLQGHVYAQLGQWAAAQGDFTQAVSRDPRYEMGYRNRAIADTQLGQFQASLADDSTAIRLDPQDAEAYADRSAAKLHLKTYQGAIADATTALGMHPSPAVAAVACDNRGQAEDQLGRQSAALADEDQAIALNPNNPEPWYQRGVMRAHGGDKKGAVADLRQAIKLYDAHGDQEGLRRAEKELFLVQF